MKQGLAGLVRTLLVAVGVSVVWAVWAGAAGADPCGLITREEAAVVLGEEVGPPRSKLVQAMAAGQSCLYATSAPLSQRGGTGTLKLIVYDPKTMAEHGIAFTSPREYFDKNFAVLEKRKVEVEEIPGLGEQARWTPGSGTLHVLAGDTYLTLEVRDLAKISAPTRAELDKKVAQHRKELALKAMKDYILPRLKTD